MSQICDFDAFAYDSDDFDDFLLVKQWPQRRPLTTRKWAPGYQDVGAGATNQGVLLIKAIKRKHSTH